jgi:hypothetical protein
MLQDLEKVLGRSSGAMGEACEMPKLEVPLTKFRHAGSFTTSGWGLVGRSCSLGTPAVPPDNPQDSF